MDNLDSSLRVLNPNVETRLGKVRHALFDFDGTLSVLREGWETVMIPVMIESICGPAPVTLEIEREVHEYVEHSTGILTILQMEWLAEAVRRHGYGSQPLTAAGYKKKYLDRLMVRVRERIVEVEAGAVYPDDRMVSGGRAFLTGLAARGVQLYLASGTDQSDVQHEAHVLGVDSYFAGRIYGALDERETHSKDRIIQRILDEHHLFGDELLVVGDGPVEIREARRHGAIALGAATDEIKRRGWNEHKVLRLQKAGADLLIPDFIRAEELVMLFVR